MDLSLIADKSGNVLAKPNIKASLKEYEYLSPAEKKAIDSSGGGLQVVFLLAVFI